MSSRLIVTKEKGLKEAGPLVEFPGAIKFPARVISYVFHPVFVPVYVVAFIVFMHPYIFAGFSPFDKTRTLIMAFMMYSFFPLVTVGLLKALKFVDSIFLETQKDRVIPLIACGVWYFWIWNVWKNLPDYPDAAVKFALGSWFSVTVALFANIIMKVSLHAIAMGVMITYLILLSFTQPLNLGFYISIGVIIAGLVCTSRLIISDHSNKEIYGGLAVGSLAMLLAQLF